MSEGRPAADGPRLDDGEVSTDRLLEALLVDDAQIVWDPTTGEARVALRSKIVLDSPAESA